MLVAHSYKYTCSGEPSTKSGHRNTPIARPPRDLANRRAESHHGTSACSSTATDLSLPPKSKPAHILPRKHAQRSADGPATPPKAQYTGRGANREGKHRSDVIPPAVAALLAVTAIPVPRGQRPNRCRISRVTSTDDLVEEWRKEYGPQEQSLCGARAIDTLLKSAEDQRSSSLYLGAESLRRLDSLRSVSSSTDSLPSMEADSDSVISLSGPSTPESSVRRSSPSRKNRMILSSVCIDKCVTSHPLMPESYEKHATQLEFHVDKLKNPGGLATRTRPSFRSNLTASLQALKSAASAFASFNAPAIPPDDHICHDFSFPCLTSELRPRSIRGFSNAQLRRYLDPTPESVPGGSTPVALDSAYQPNVDNHSPMIEMQCYAGRAHCAKNEPLDSADGRDVPITDGGNVPPNIRHGEPRENSDFLRIIVLELNMRREGKLAPKAAGRARMWLPARASCRRTQTAAGVPSRWLPITCNS